jgi:pimeloyl-[acyl-carrier protein] methyl ester esterase
MTGSRARQLIAMHGWAGDSRAWAPWRAAASRRGWHCRCGERGYGPLEPATPEWAPGARRRAVIVHSLGLHLLPEPVLADADAVVLLASFGRFLPADGEARRWRRALRGMAARLEQGDAQAMLRDFLAEAAAPEPAAALPEGPGSEPLRPEGVERLRRDLERLQASAGLPAAYPAAARSLIVEAGADRIVAAESRAALRRALPQATVWPLEGAGHSLLGVELLEPVFDWLEGG